VGIVLRDPSLLVKFYKSSSEDFVLNGLLKCGQEKVREEFRHSLTFLAKKLTKRGDP
jgi:hypothetical protein